MFKLCAELRVVCSHDITALIESLLHGMKMLNLPTLMTETKLKSLRAHTNWGLGLT